MLLTTTWYGTFIIDPDSGAVIKKKLFQKNVNRLVGQLHAIQNCEILPEERSLVKGFKEPLNVTDSRLKGLGGFIDAIEPLPDSITLSPEDYGFEPELYHQVMLELGKLRTREAIGEDSYIIQAVKGLDELTQTANLLSERLHEWYGLHWPELGGAVNEIDYIHLISELGDREAILEKSDNQNLKHLSVMDSVGVDFNPEDKNAVIGFAQQLENVHTSKITLENYIKTKMENLAPNLTLLIGPIIGARLISLTGGLSRLAVVSSSTIQLLGAEKALFRHLRDGELPPKHGIIFQHPLVHNAPYWQRGKIARAFAGKIAIAAKLDHNSDKFIGEELSNDLNRRIEDIRKKYPNAPIKSKGKKHLRGGESRGKKGKKGKKTRRGGRGKGKKRR